MNFYSGYRIHNYHFAAYGAMFLGQFEPAIRAAQELIDTTPEELLRVPSPPMADFLESYMAIKQHVLVRFGKWREIIAQELPKDRDLYCSTTAMTLYAKGIAHSVLGEIAQAENEEVEEPLSARTNVLREVLIDEDVNRGKEERVADAVQRLNQDDRRGVLRHEDWS